MYWGYWVIEVIVVIVVMMDIRIARFIRIIYIYVIRVIMVIRIIRLFTCCMKDKSGILLPLLGIEVILKIISIIKAFPFSGLMRALM